MDEQQNLPGTGPGIHGTRRLLLGGVIALALQGCMTTQPLETGKDDLALSECPSLPNCVSTEAEEDSMHAIPAFELAMPLDDAWPKVRQAVKELPNTTLVEEDASRGYLYAKSYSDVFGFVDYFEVLAQPQPIPESGAQRLAVRSAAKLGISDMGVNEARAEQFRAVLQDAGVIAR